MKELRDIKLDLLMGNQNPIVDLFNKITKDIKIINTNVYNEDGLEFIYFAPAESSENYNKDVQWIFYQDCKNEKFWTHYSGYWSLFESNFHLKYEEIQAITKVLVEEALKREVGTPPPKVYEARIQVEEALKREVGPVNTAVGCIPRVEDALKREVGTPTSNGILNESHVEEALKRAVSPPELSTPFASFAASIVCRVEEALKRELVSPPFLFSISTIQVEDALKREVGTPAVGGHLTEMRVAKALNSGEST